MLDIGWTELVVIGVVALIVIGPRDLPEMFRTLGRFTAKLRSMSRDFTRAMEAAADEAGVKDVAKDLKSATSAKAMGLDAVKDAAAKFEKWDPIKNAARPSTPTNPATKPLTPPPMPAPPAPVAAVVETPVVAEMGPATRELAEKVAAKKAIAQEAAEKLRAVDAPPAAAEPPAKKLGRVRKPKAAATETESPE